MNAEEFLENNYYFDREFNLDDLPKICEDYHQHKLSEITDAWNKYVNYLKEKYPAKDGERWEFTCEHHQKIDNLLK